MEIALSLSFGAVVGFALGMTGGGGSIFAVPLLVYGLSIAPRQAVGVSLAAVGATALVGFLTRLRSGLVESKVGLLFAAGGVAGAPLGSWLAGQIPETILLMLFALLMLVVAARMWRKSSPSLGEKPTPKRLSTCRRDQQGRLAINSRCAGVLLAVGLLTGILAGLFGVGGGFVIVPALVLVSGMGIHRAVGTSLLVIALISAAGVAANVVSGRLASLDQLQIAAWFLFGGLAGMGLGTLVGRRLSPVVLQKTFALAMVAVALLIVGNNLLGR